MENGSTELAQITPTQAFAPNRERRAARRPLTSREKAAVIVRLLVAQDTPIILSSLPEHTQAALTEQMGKMRLVDRGTLNAVVAEFVAELEEVGLAFPGGIEGALSIMDGHISATAANRLRRLAGASSRADPWDRISAMEVDRLLPVLEEESIEVAAVMLSKLVVPKAAELLGRLEGARARRVAYAVSQTVNVDPETVRRIGLSLATQLENQPPRAFETGAVERVGAILNVTPQLVRDDVLAGLEQDDEEFAKMVRKAIFTFFHIPARINTRDIPKIARVLDQAVLVTALTYASAKKDLAPTAEFILDNMSQRMAQTLREEMDERGKVTEKDGEAAQGAVIAAIRGLESAGELAFIQEEE
ncbi:flagellar motor switch protein FliG [Pseudorhodobacter turbinis]|uniref:Flagellar motor switch protein FliG n=1 Tax=Pseudorhodobacter turbinis TaxID=2500533 RepID=A0A4P8ECA6_9RHOB|nr:FliG C-terminal domain-containing protein [Pseudorhodobacter turbinis]QCO54490.1 flagellar motor switch protein FliG [Pseudorhodobacter turbinis]